MRRSNLWNFHLEQTFMIPCITLLRMYYAYKSILSVWVSSSRFRWITIVRIAHVGSIYILRRMRTRLEVMHSGRLGDFGCSSRQIVHDSCWWVLMFFLRLFSSALLYILKPSVHSSFSWLVSNPTSHTLLASSSSRVENTKNHNLTM